MTLIAFVYFMLFSPAREQYHQQLNMTWLIQTTLELVTMQCIVGVE